MRTSRRAHFRAVASGPPIVPAQNDLRRRKLSGLLVLTAILLTAISASPSSACELCAIYGADNALGNSGSGFLLTFSEQYISAHSLQAEGEPFSTVPFLSQAYLDSSY